MKYSWIVLVWVAVVIVLLRATPAPGTDASRFADKFSALREEVFYWHESMYISETWVPDWDWYMDVNHKIDEFRKELDRLPDSACAQEARAVVSFSGPWLAYAPADIAMIEAEWKAAMDKLPLSCKEF